MKTKCLLILPCFNEEEILENSVSKLKKYYDSLKEKGLLTQDSKICLVNDGSRDSTWQIIEKLSSALPEVTGICFSRNFGHQPAILAGLLENKGAYDCYITIDADLQDDINVIEQMVEKYQNGASIVYGVRNDRSSDSWFKRITAEGFYSFTKKLGVPVVFNHADFRLIDNAVLNELYNFKETNLFIRGIIPTIGFKTDKVFYKRLEREAGETKYPLKKMLLFAWNGITSFSTLPMRFVLYFGFFNFLLALGIAAYVVVSKIFGVTVPGWTSTLLPTAFFSGSNMIAIGLIGEYIGKIYEEVKARPRYIVEKKILKDE